MTFSFFNHPTSLDGGLFSLIHLIISSLWQQRAHHLNCLSRLSVAQKDARLWWVASSMLTWNDFHILVPSVSYSRWGGGCCQPFPPSFFSTERPTENVNIKKLERGHQDRITWKKHVLHYFSNLRPSVNKMRLAQLIEKSQLEERWVLKNPNSS